MDEKRLNRLSELQTLLEDAEKVYLINPTESNNNNLVIIRDEIEIFLNMNRLSDEDK